MVFAAFGCVAFGSTAEPPEAPGSFPMTYKLLELADWAGPGTGLAVPFESVAAFGRRGCAVSGPVSIGRKGLGRLGAVGVG